LFVSAAVIGVLPTKQVYSRLPAVDWGFFVKHARWTEIGLAVLAAALVIGVIIFVEAGGELRARIMRGFAILRDPPRLLRGVILPQALSWVLRVASLYYLLEAFRVHASIHNALLALVVDSLATLFPATPGGAGTKQGLIVYLFRGEAYSKSLLLAFSVGANIATVVFNLTAGLIALFMLARTISWRRLRQAQAQEQQRSSPQSRDGCRHYPGRVPYASIFPLVTARAVARAFTYEVEEGVGPGAIVSMPFGRRRARGVVVSLESSAPDGVSPVAVEKVVGQVPPALVDLALWVADYYGSTPARALALVAPESARRRKEQAPPAERQSLQGEAAPAELFPEQRAAIDRIVEAFDSGGGTSLLLFGPTGSGKTEVYLQACAAILERGLGAIVLVPEISLTPQTVGRVRARFGERVAILHSGLTEAERRDERERIASGEARVVVGARSAVFAPVRGLGLIVVDEEHDSSYKQDSDPRYDARTVAAKRASLEGAVAVFGSATPRPESWAVLERLELGGRVGGALPPVQVVDLRREAGYPLSAPLLAELRRVAEAGGKAILLLNRRGIAPALHCRACGRTIRCPNCDVSLVLHHDGVLHCHHCGHAERDPDTCPSCGSAEDARLGAGTQWLERELGRELPDLEPIRLDARHARKARSSPQRRFAGSPRPRAVLLGTQMVAKGHHFAGVELAAVIDADWALGMPDFRAEERTFQLLTQLAGRSGREAPGRVVIQTFQPDARPIVHAARHDVRGFLAEELDRRNALGYPPAGHLVRIVVSGSDPAPVERALTELRDGMPGVELLGPAPLLRLRRRHRAQLIAKTDRPRAVATRAAALLAAAAPAMLLAGPTAVVDVDPHSL
jgi:primosomal protein N' (replication factor Y)